MKTEKKGNDQKLCNASWASVTEPCATGKSQEKLQQSEQQGDIEDMISPHIQLGLPGIGLSSSMSESHQPSKRKICSVNVNISNPNILMESLSKKLEEGSIISEKKCLPYWSGSCQEMSNVLCSHIKTGTNNLVSICCSGFVPNTLAKSWFSTKLSFLPKEKWLKTFFQSSTVSQPDCTNSESIHLKSQKIRVYPEKSLHLLWKKWLAASRYCFNQAIAYQRQHSFISKYDLRQVILNLGGDGHPPPARLD